MTATVSICRRLLVVVAALVSLLWLPAQAGDERPPVVAASILPLHSLLANLVDAKNLLPPLLPPSASPHSYALRPSEARRLREAAIIFWVGPRLEGVLARPLATLPASVKVVALLDPRSKADPHIWLDPVNAEAIARQMADALARLDPARARAYRERERALISRLSALSLELDKRFAPVRAIPFVTAHSAYGYLEARFGLNGLGGLGTSTEQAASAGQMARLHARARAAGVRCVFAEPQYHPRAIAAFAADTGARIATLDPLGRDLTPGPDAYFTLMRNLAAHMIACLGAQDQ